MLFYFLNDILLFVCASVRITVLNITAVLEWLVRLLNVSFDIWVVPMEWRGACIVPLYKGKGDKCECSNSRGISLLSVVIW